MHIYNICIFIYIHIYIHIHIYIYIIYIYSGKKTTYLVKYFSIFPLSVTLFCIYNKTHAEIHSKSYNIINATIGIK